MKVSYTTDIASGVLSVSAGQLQARTSQQISQARMKAGGTLTLRLTSAQNATIDADNRERTLFPGGDQWQFHVTSQPATARQLADALDLDRGWQLYSWNTTTQRWVQHTASQLASTRLAAGTAITYRGAKPAQDTLRQAGLAPSNTTTLRQGWNIFTPAPAAVGLTSRDFNTIGTGANQSTSVFFDPRLTNCENLAGILVIYTYDQTDTHADNGFRIALPCHPDLAYLSGIAPIETIDQNDTIYTWFNNTTPVNLTYTNGQYTPTG